MTPFRIRLFPRFLAFIVLLSVVPVAMVGWKVVGINSESLQDEVLRYHSHLAQSMADKLDERVSTLQSQLKMGIGAFVNPGIDWGERRNLLSLLIDSSPTFAIISAVTNEGKEIMKVYSPKLAPEVEENPSLISHANKPLFRSFKKFYAQVAEVERVGANTFASIYMPFDTPSGKSALYVKVSLDDIIESISNETIGATGFAYYVGKDGELLSVPNSPTLKIDRVLKDESIVQSALAGNRGAREFQGQDGVDWVGASAPVKKLGGAVITQQTHKEAYEDSAKSIRTAIILVLITILIAIIAAFFLARSLVNPLLKISKVAQAVDLSTGRFPEPVNIQTRDEIQDVAETFNSMLEKLKGYAGLQVEKLIIEQKKTEAIIYSIEDGIVMTDFNGRIQLISHIAKRYLGIPEDTDPMGEPLLKVSATSWISSLV